MNPPKRDQNEPRSVPRLMLARSWGNAADIGGWWMSEKLDGVRAYWDGRQFLSRQGNAYVAPAWFLDGLPSTPLDGELWIARRAFQRTVSIVRSHRKSDDWRNVRFLVFDAPDCPGGFEERMAFLTDNLRSVRSMFCAVHHHERCKSIKYLQSELRRIESLGGEGLMMRQPGSVYEVGRSRALLKVKTFHDADAVVIGHSAGKGRHEGRLGALVVQLSDGTAFSVGTGLSDVQRRSPPAIGSVITFRYQEFTDGGVPRFPSFVRVHEGSASKEGASTAPEEGVSIR